MPLMHPAHALPAGTIALGAGVAGHVNALELDTQGTTAITAEDLTIAPGVSPGVSGRVGIIGDNEASLTYSGRAFRVGGRHVFPIGPLHLSTEIGAHAVVPRAREDDDVTKVFGGGGDVPILMGWTSQAELYSVWAGPRGGFSLLSGQALPTLIDGADPLGDAVPFDGTTWYVGGLIGFSIGFRSFHATLELNLAYSRADGTFGEAPVSADYFLLTPGGAFNLTF